MGIGRPTSLLSNSMADCSIGEVTRVHVVPDSSEMWVESGGVVGLPTTIGKSCLVNKQENIVVKQGGIQFMQMSRFICYLVLWSTQLKDKLLLLEMTRSLWSGT